MESLIQHRFELKLNDDLRQQVRSIAQNTAARYTEYDAESKRKITEALARDIGYRVLWTVELDDQPAVFQRQPDSFLPATSAFFNGTIQFDLNAPARSHVFITLIGQNGEGRYVCSTMYSFQTGTLNATPVDGLRMIAEGETFDPIQITIKGKNPGQHDAGPPVMAREAEQVSADGRVRALGGVSV